MHEPLRSTDRVCAEGAAPAPRLRELAMIPRGAALITSSGALAARGIAAIVHAAPAAASRTGAAFDPTLESIRLAVANALRLAARHGHARVALPFLGGGLFAARLGLEPARLAAEIAHTAARHAGEVTPVLVAYDAADGERFRRALGDRLDHVEPGDRAEQPDRAEPAGPAGPARVEVAVGSIVEPAVHRASAIVNAANMEVRFGGGVSGVIAAATGRAAQIEAEARAAIEAFWRAQER